MSVYWLSALAFALSFLFAMGGIGSALVLIPVINWFGIPLNTAKPIGLFVNTVSMIGATILNLRQGKVDFKVCLPMVISSIIMAPIGAYLSTFIPQTLVLALFAAFLLFSGNMMLFFKSGKYKDQYRADRPMLPLLLTGSAAGLISGLLGVGGGGLIAPAMLITGFNPKKIAVATAFVVPFSSLTGFIAYWTMGDFDPTLALPVGLAACAGGYIGARVMHSKLSAQAVKKGLAVVILVLGVKMLLRLIG